MLPAPKVVDNVFLKLDMPINEKLYPADRVFQSEQSYTIPFDFTIPHVLSKDMCDALSEPGHMHDLHMRLPPTMGSWEKDDQSPVMARVEYAVVARVLHRRASGLGHPIEAAHPIKILPGFPEDPPLTVTERDTRYTLGCKKSVRRTLLSAQKDRLAVTACQPGAVRLGARGHQLAEPATSALLDFSFTSESTFASPPPPPEVSLGQARLEALTWFSGMAMKSLPELGDARDVSAVRRELKYSTHVKLAPIDMGGIAWQQEKDEQGRWVWRAAARFPIQLPTAHKMFLPTFHSCFVARTYTLHLPVNFAGTKINLAVPLQIAVETSVEAAPLGECEELPGFDAALAWR